MEGKISGHPAATFGESFFRADLDPVDMILQAESFVLQKQKNLAFYAFGIWHSKTRVSRGLSNG